MTKTNIISILIFSYFLPSYCFASNAGEFINKCDDYIKLLNNEQLTQQETFNAGVCKGEILSARNFYWDGCMISPGIDYKAFINRMRKIYTSTPILQNGAEEPALLTFTMRSYQKDPSVTSFGTGFREREKAGACSESDVMK